MESGSGGITWNTKPGLLSGGYDNKGAIATSTWVEFDVTVLVSGNGTPGRVAIATASSRE